MGSEDVGTIGGDVIEDIAVRMCKDCIDGVGKVCHNPACVLCRCDVPIASIRDLVTPLPRSQSYYDNREFPGDLIEISRHLRDSGFAGYADTVADAVHWMLANRAPDRQNDGD